MHFKGLFRVKIFREIVLLLQTLGRYISVVAIYLLEKSYRINSINLTWQITCFGGKHCNLVGY